jgi:hypothetical protein
MPYLKFFDKFIPSFRAPIPPSSRGPSMATKFLRNINNDPLVENVKIPVRNLVVNEIAFKRFNEREAGQV